MKFCPVVPEICRGQVHGARKERRITRRRRRRIIIIIIRNRAKTISLQTLCGRLNNRTEFHETCWSYRYMFLVDLKVFRFVVKEVKAIFLGVQRGRGLL
jgi:hypothetical protein